MITDRQTRLLRQKRMEGKTQETAAAKAGMSVRSARKWQSGPLPSQAKPEHRWRTRPDPFDGVWEEEIEPLLRNDPTGKLKATTIIDWLAEQHPGRFSASQLRTLQRRLQDWRALHGPDQEVYFPQEHPPGRALPHLEMLPKRYHSGLHCLKQMLPTFGCTRSLGRSCHEIGDCLATDVGNARCDASVALICPCVAPASALY